MTETLTCNLDAMAVEEAAEAYVLRRMSFEQHERFEEHLLVCQRCQDAVQEFDVFLSAARVVLAGQPARPRKERRLRAKTAAC